MRLKTKTKRTAEELGLSPEDFAERYEKIESEPEEMIIPSKLPAEKQAHIKIMINAGKDLFSKTRSPSEKQKEASESIRKAFK